MGGLAAEFRKETFERQQRRLASLHDGIAADIAIELFLDRLVIDERVSEMFERAAESAARSSSRDKVRLLARVLAQAATADDEARVDEAEQLLRVVVEVDPIDLRALAALAKHEDLGRENSVEHYLQAALRVSAATAGPVIARLERLSLVFRERDAWLEGGPAETEVALSEQWRLTPTAQELMKMLLALHQAE